MELNKVVIFLSILAIGILIIVPTMTKVNNSHLDKSYLVATKKITESAEKCYYEKKCLNTKITIKELIEKGYMEALVNPRTEEYFKNTSYVTVGVSSSETTLHLD